MMEIRYNVRRSSFYNQLAVAIDESQRLTRPVTVELGGRGLTRGDVLIRVTADRPDVFLTDWEGSDQSWFSARLRAAATVIRDLKLYGDDRGSHRADTLNLRKI